MKKQLTDYRILIIAALVIIMAAATSCSTSKSGYGCPPARQGARHDKNLRFGAYVPVIIKDTAPDCVASREAK
jgi:hypothetical protein